MPKQRFPSPETSGIVAPQRGIQLPLPEGTGCGSLPVEISRHVSQTLVYDDNLFKRVIIGVPYFDKPIKVHTKSLG